MSYICAEDTQRSISTIQQGGQRTPRSRANNGKYLRFQKKIISDHLNNKTYLLSYKNNFNVLKSSNPMLTSFVSIHCHLFMKCSRLPGHFGKLTMISVGQEQVGRFFIVVVVIVIIIIIIIIIITILLLLLLLCAQK